MFTEIEGRERLLKSPLRIFERHLFKRNETAPDRDSLKLTDESNLQSMLEASLKHENEKEAEAGA